MSIRFRLGYLCILPVLASGCATPIRPSGGPVDSVPPALISSQPANGDVNVEADRVVLEFSERLDASSASRAVSVAPAFDTPPQVRARGRSLEIVFPDSLREETTYVISLGSELRDEHGIALQRPIAMAFTTGDVLDRGRISGRLINPASNTGIGGFQLFAFRLPAVYGVLDSLSIPPDSIMAMFSGANARYSLPDPRTDPPTYSTEATGDGSFRLEYLREGPYFIVALEDLNRNRRADDRERFAVPAFAVGIAVADSASGESIRALELFVTVQDTSPPQLRRSRSISNQRFALSFDEPVRLRSHSTTAWTLSDSATGVAAALASVYQNPNTPTEILLRSSEALLSQPYLLTTSSTIADSSGNGLNLAATIVPSASPDTLSIRFEGFLPAAAAADSVFLLRPDAWAGVRFNQPIDSLDFRQRVSVRGSDGLLDYTTETQDGVRYDLNLPSAVRAFRVEVQMTDSTYTRRFAVPGADALGSISGRVEVHGESVVRVEAHPASGSPFESAANTNGTFAIRNLPPGAYRLRLYVDFNENGRWDGGSLAPYAPPEPLLWLSAPISVRARWEHEIEEPVDFNAD